MDYCDVVNALNRSFSNPVQVFLSINKYNSADRRRLWAFLLTSSGCPVSHETSDP